MNDIDVMLKIDYEENKEFKEYVDKYCRTHNIDKYTAFTHKLVQDYHEYLLMSKQI